MLIQRQLPKLYCRGSIFNITATDLTNEQRDDAEKIVFQMADELSSDRTKFKYKLSNTIGADYKDMSEGGPGDTEFCFALRKATLHLLHHCDYTFECKACGATHYTNNSGRRTKIDQRKPFCPKCGRCEISDPRESGLEVGSFLTQEELLLVIDQLADDGKQEPKTRSCIKAIPGERKNVDPELILNDPDQRQRYFREFVYNYLKQVIKENKIQKQFVESEISGPNDLVAIEMILAYLRKNEIKFSYDSLNSLHDGYRHIKCDLFGLAPRFVPELAEIVHKIQSWGVEVDFDHYGVKVKDKRGGSRYVSTEIKTRDYVIMETSLKATDGEKSIDKIEALEDKMNDLVDFELEESWETVRNSLSEEAVKVFEILSQNGPAYVEFSAQFGPNKPRKADIQEYLGVSSKSLNDKISEIKTQWIRLVPATAF